MKTDSESDEEIILDDDDEHFSNYKEQILATKYQLANNDEDDKAKNKKFFNLKDSSDSDEPSLETKHLNSPPPPPSSRQKPLESPQRPTSAAFGLPSPPSTARRPQFSAKQRPKSGMGVRRMPSAVPRKHSESDTESDDVDVNTETASKKPVPGEYDPQLFEHLQVDGEIKELFQYITKYTPQQLNLDYKMIPFIPDYIPAVGDIDAFLKVLPPTQSIDEGDEPFDQSVLRELGLEMLDEPSSVQSDPAVLHLQLRATSVKTTNLKDVVVKKVDNVDKNGKVIDKWIKDISDLRGAKPPPIFKYSDPMPELEDLMQPWPDDIERQLGTTGFPGDKTDCSLSEYLSIVCTLLDIPVYDNKLQSVHLLFSLFCAIKNSENNQPTDDGSKGGTATNTTPMPDQLVLE